MSEPRLRATDAESAYKRAYRRRPAEGRVRTHSAGGYANGCRCPVCRAAHSAYELARRRA